MVPKEAAVSSRGRANKTRKEEASEQAQLKFETGEKMELLKLSKFKLHLRALITEVRDLKERERYASEQLYLLHEKQKQIGEEFSRNLTKLQAELATSNELVQKLERKVSYLQNDNALLENKQKELKGTVSSLLQSRETFLEAYEESTCEMRRSIEYRDRKIAVLSEKINAHSLLFNSIEKEALSVKQIVDSVQCVLRDKEEIVLELKSKVDKVSTFEKVFFEKINNLEKKLKFDENELRRKEKIISELEVQVELAKNSNRWKLQIEDKTLTAKEVVLQNLISENKALRFELGTLGVIMQKIHGALSHMNEKDRKAFSVVLPEQEKCAASVDQENERIKDLAQSSDGYLNKESERGDTENTASSLQWEYSPTRNQLADNNKFDSFVSEEAYSAPRSACSVPQPAAEV